MACFTVPTTAAIVTTLMRKKVPAKYHFEWLNLMLWGGSIMLILDHIINGELTWRFPFFTRSFSVIWREILKVGVPMTALTILVWAAMVAISWQAENKKMLVSQKQSLK